MTFSRTWAWGDAHPNRGQLVGKHVLANSAGHEILYQAPWATCWNFGRLTYLVRKGLSRPQIFSHCEGCTFSITFLWWNDSGEPLQKVMFTKETRLDLVLVVNCWDKNMSWSFDPTVTKASRLNFRRMDKFFFGKPRSQQIRSKKKTPRDSHFRMLGKIPILDAMYFRSMRVGTIVLCLVCSVEKCGSALEASYDVWHLKRPLWMGIEEFSINFIDRERHT